MGVSESEIRGTLLGPFFKGDPTICYYLGVLFRGPLS